MWFVITKILIKRDKAEKKAILKYENVLESQMDGE